MIVKTGIDDRLDVAGHAAWSHKYGGDKMAVYVSLVVAMDDPFGDESSNDGNGTGWTRFGKRVLCWDDHGFVALDRYASVAAAERWCWLNMHADEYDLFIESDSRHGYNIHCNDMSRNTETAGSVDGAFAVARDMMEESGVYPSIWLDYLPYDEDGVYLGGAYYDAMLLEHEARAEGRAFWERVTA